MKILKLVSILSVLAIILFLTNNSTSAKNNIGNSVTLVEDSQSQYKPFISIVKPSHSFGEIAQNVPVEHKFELENSGNEPLILTEVKASCGCTATEWTKAPIAPGEKAFVTATFNAKKVGKFNKSITVFSNSEDNLKLSFNGTVLAKEE